MTTPAWQVRATGYDERYAGAAKSLGQTEFTPAWIPLVPPGSRVLDLGCAGGWAARQLVERDCTVVGLELDPQAAGRAAAWCERVVVCDLDRADLSSCLEKDAFDVVVAADILEHLRDPVRVLHSVRGFLAPGGRIVASIPNVAHGSVRLALLTGEFPYADAGILDRTHLRFFTIASIRELFEASGYVVAELNRFEMPIRAGVQFDPGILPEGVERLVADMPEATTFQFLLVAIPDLAHHPAEQRLSTSTDESEDIVTLAGSIALRDLDRTIFELREEILTLESRLSEITDSRMWRAWANVRALRPVAMFLSLERRLQSHLSSSKLR